MIELANRRLVSFGANLGVRLLNRAVRKRALCSLQGYKYGNHKPVASQHHTWLAANANSSSSTRQVRSFSTTHRVSAPYALASGEELTCLSLSKPHEHVVHIELNNPKARNALSLEAAQELLRALDHLDEDASIRCVLLSGSGPHFTSGVDVKSFMGVYAQLQETEDIARRARLLHKVIETFQAPFKRMYLFGKPIVCTLHGYCYGLGVELAACSDIRYCSADLRLGPREVLIGIAADVGSLQEMPRLVSNQSLLRELLYTGRDASADESLGLGFVSKVLADKQAAAEAALDLAIQVAKRSPVAVQGTKRNLRASRDRSFLEGLDYNAVWNMSMMQSADLAKAIEAILTRSEQVDYDDF